MTNALVDTHWADQPAYTQSSSRLISLPAELLVEALKLVAWKDILYLRVTCKYLVEMTKTRAIWEHLVREHILAKPYPPRLERSIEMYTAGELEHLLLLWNSADIGWETDDGHAARERSIAFKPAKFAHLIRGGRWMLLTTKTGKVTYYDLDAENVVGMPLIPDQIRAYNPFNEILMTIDLNTDSPILNFRIGFSIMGEFTYTSMIQIWDVGLLFDGSHAVGLRATLLASFPHRPGIALVSALSLLGPIVAFNAMHSENMVSTFVVEWARAEESPTAYPWRVLDPTTILSFIQLLDNNRIFIISGETIQLCDYSAVKETIDTFPGGEHDAVLPYIWRTNLKDFDPADNSDCFFTVDAACFILMSRKTFYSITIDTSSCSSEPPPLVELICLPGFEGFDTVVFLGYAGAVAVDHDGDEARVVRYTLPSEGGLPTILHKQLAYMLPPECRSLEMDEESGRIVVLGEREMMVIDFALIFKSSR